MGSSSDFWMQSMRLSPSLFHALIILVGCGQDADPIKNSDRRSGKSPLKVPLAGLPAAFANVSLHQTEVGGDHYDAAIRELQSLACVEHDRCESEVARRTKEPRTPIGRVAAELLSWPSTRVQAVGVTLACAMCAELGQRCPCSTVHNVPSIRGSIGRGRSEAGVAGDRWVESGGVG